MMVIHSSRLRTFLRYAIPFVLIPALVAVSALLFEGQRYLIISLGIAVLNARSSALLFTGSRCSRSCCSRRAWSGATSARGAW